jgi:hypothetical protein
VTETCPIGQADQIGISGVVADVHGPVAPELSGSKVADAADGADGIFPSCTHPDQSASSSDPTEHNVDAQCSQERLRATQAEPQAQGLYPGLNLKVLCSLPQSIRLDQKLRRNFPRIVDSVDHLGRERALP